MVVSNRHHLRIGVVPETDGDRFEIDQERPIEHDGTSTTMGAIVGASHETTTALLAYAFERGNLSELRQ